MIMYEKKISINPTVLICFGDVLSMWYLFWGGWEDRNWLLILIQIINNYHNLIFNRTSFTGQDLFVYMQENSLDGTVSLLSVCEMTQSVTIMGGLNVFLLLIWTCRWTNSDLRRHNAHVRSLQTVATLSNIDRISLSWTIWRLRDKVNILCFGMNE